MVKPHAWHFDQECIDINRIPLHTNLFKFQNANFITDHKIFWLQTLLPVPYHLCRTPIVVHSEINSRAVQILEQKGWVTAHWFSHAALAKDWFRYAEHDPILQYKTFIDANRFLIYNRAWTGTREYRLALAEMLATQGLLPYCKTSLSFQDEGKHYSQHKWRRPQWQPKIALEDYFQPNSTASVASADFESRDYSRMVIEVVLETIFDTDHVSLTEKSLRPMATATPFILAGPAHSLQYLRRYGFETFSPWINESYDLEIDAPKRLVMIVQELSRLAKLGHKKFKIVLDNCQTIAYRNRARFFHHDFHTEVFEEYRNGMQQAVAKAQCTVDTRLWKLVQHLHSPQQQKWVDDFVRGKKLVNQC